MIVRRQTVRQTDVQKGGVGNGQCRQAEVRQKPDRQHGQGGRRAEYQTDMGQKGGVWDRQCRQAGKRQKPDRQARDKQIDR